MKAMIWSKRIRRMTAMILLITMLPFSGFTGIGIREVSGATANEGNEALLSANQVNGMDALSATVEQEAMPQSTEDVIILQDRTLTEDMVVRTLTIESGRLDLNGYTLYVCENLYQSGGELLINGGDAVINGDYRIQKAAEKAESKSSDEAEEEGTQEEAELKEIQSGKEGYTSSAGSLHMTGAEDYLLVVGNFYMDSSVNHKDFLTNGRMEVRGNFCQYASQATANFYSTEQFTLVLAGEERQYLYMENSGYMGQSALANLVIDNQSEAGAAFYNSPYVSGTVTSNESRLDGLLAAGNGTTMTEPYFDGGLDVIGAMYIDNSLCIGKDLYVRPQNAYLSVKADLEVKGNAVLGSVVSVKAANLIIDGNVQISTQAASLTGESVDCYCGFDMTGENSRVLVKGSYYQKAAKVPAMTKGVLELKGNVTVIGKLGSEENHRVVLSGEKEQHISLQEGASFSILELQNTSEEGVIVDAAAAWDTLIRNGCKLSFGENGGYQGYTLTGDESVSGEFVLLGGTLDLNGHTMTISGNLIQSGGKIILNGGSLIVEGDYRRQTREKNEDGSFRYGGTDSSLVMNTNEDYILVKGDFYDASTKSFSANLTGGCLEVKGNFYLTEESAENGFYTRAGTNEDKKHTLLFSGDKKQVVHFLDSKKYSTEHYDSYTCIENLKITNVSEEGVVIEGDAQIYGRCESERESHIEGWVYFGNSNETELGEYYAGDVVFISNFNSKSAYEIGGDVQIWSSMSVYADLTIGGNLYVQDHPKYGYSMNVFLYDAQITVKGNVEFESISNSTGIFMRAPTAKVRVEGNYTIGTMKYAHYISQGTLEIGGNLFFQSPLIVNNNARLVLCGDKKQTLVVCNETYFKTLELQNTSEEGVCFNSYVHYNQLIDNGCRISYFGQEGLRGYTLNEDETLQGPIVLKDGTMDLNGKTLTIKGDLIQMDGILNVNGGTLIVEGSYYIGNPDTMWDETANGTSSGYLWMTSPEDYVLVKQDFYISWERPNSADEAHYYGNSRFTDGILEVKGDFVQKEKEYLYDTKTASFPAEGNHTVVLSGEEQQTVWFSASQNGSHIANLQIKNNSEDGIVFRGAPPVIGSIDATREQHLQGYLGVSSMEQIKGGYFGGSIVNSGKMSITDDVEIGGDFKVAAIYVYNSDTEDVVLENNAALQIGGNLFVEGEFLVLGDIETQGNLTVKELLKIRHGQVKIGQNAEVMKEAEYYDSYGIQMSYADSYLKVGGDFENQGNHSRFYEGTLEVKGDFTDCDNAGSYGTTHRVLLSGNGLQTVETTKTLGILELHNDSTAGVYSAETIKKNKLILNGCRLIIGDGSGSYGFTLTDDYIAGGDFTLLDDTLDLNGKTLTVQGDFILQDGCVKLNGGTLIVEGNLRFQTRKREDEKYLYTEGMGQLLMGDEKDTVIVKGDCILQPGESIAEDLKEGTIELGGSLQQMGSNSLDFGGTLILNGTGKQSVYSDTQIALNGLTIENASEGGIFLGADILVSGKMEDLSRNISGSGAVILRDLEQLSDEGFQGNIILEGECTLTRPVAIGKSLTVKEAGVLHLGSGLLRCAGLIVDGKLYTDQATCIVENALTVRGEGLFAMTGDAYVLVKGDAAFLCSTSHEGYLTDGVLEVMGSFVADRGYRNFVATGEHYTIFRRKNTAEAENSKQVVKINNPDSIHFHKLELTKGLPMQLDEPGGYYIPYTAERIADEVIYITPGAIVPDPISSISANEVTVTSATLSYGGSWPEGIVKGFAVYRDGVKVATTNERSYTDTGLAPGTSYTYQIYPYNEDNTGAKSAPSYIVVTPADELAPEIPESLEIKTRTGSCIGLSWGSSRDNVAVKGYRLYRDGKQIYDGAETEFKDSGLKENVLYTYCLKAYDEAGNESEAGETVDGVVFMPKITKVVPQDYTTIGGSRTTLMVYFENGGNSRGNRIKMEYYDSVEERWIPITQPALGQRTFDAKTLVASYNWDITNLDIEGDMDVRYTVTDADGNVREQIVTYLVDRSAPEAPGEVVAEDDGGTVVITWDISKNGDCTGYEFYKINMDTGTGGKLADISGRNASWYRDSEVEDGNTYRYYLRAVDAFEQKSPMSDVAEVFVAEDTKAPRVTDMTPAAGKVNGITKLTVSGRDNRSVAEFKLYIRNTSEEEWHYLDTVKAQDSCAEYAWDTTGLSEETYYIKAVAKDANGNVSSELFMRRYVVDNTGIAKIRMADTTVGSTAVQLSWEDVTEEDFGWFIVEELKDGEWKQIGKVTDRLGFQIENLEPEHTYTYRVTGIDNIGNQGIPSDPVTVTTKEDTAPPAIVTINPVSSYFKDRIDLSMRVKDNAGVNRGVFSYQISDGGFSEIATVSANGLKEENISWHWDISMLPEGEVTVRFEAYDTAGFHNALYEEKQIENTYIIDRHAPEQVKAAAVTANEGCISLSWESVSDNDIASYEIERALEDEGIFEKIGSTDNTLYFHDTKVQQSVTYRYRVSAVDIAGNKGQPSKEVCATVKPDKEAPVVTGISPADATAGKNATVKVLATDNYSLKSIVVEYREADSDDFWHEMADLPASGRGQYASFTWDTAGLSEGVIYEVRAKACDAAGNESEYKTKAYTLDLTAPKAPKLSVKSGSFCVEMEYSGNEEEDFRCYKIYRKKYGEQDYTCIQATTNTSFTDLALETDTTYYYKVRAYDIYDNYSESNIMTCFANHIDAIAPVASLAPTTFGYTGMEVIFDGSLCSDNVRINRYTWDFGDGSKKTGIRPVHVYEKSGIYTVTLTVSDAAGNEAFTTSNVRIMDKENKGSAVIKVESEQGNALSGAYVYVKTGNGSEDILQLRTDANGEAKAVCEAGVYEYAAFSEGYMPEEGTIRISNYEILEEAVRLEKGEVVTGELTVERMELDELIEKGVDLSAPENYHTFTFKTELWFASCPLPVVMNVTENYDGIRKTNNVNVGKSIGTFTSGNGGMIDVILLNPTEEKFCLEEGYCPGITYLQTTQSVSFMKDMYNVELGIMNNADSSYTITNASATLNLPEGLSLAATKSGQTLTTVLGDIGGQESASAAWVVKGDKTGSYQISASFHGVLQPFCADMDAQFEAKMEFEVPGGEGIHIYVHPEDAYYPGENYYIQYEIVNESARDFYNLKTTLGEYIQSSHLEEVFVKDINTDRLLQTYRSGGYTYRSASAAHCRQIPVLYDGDTIDVGVFSPGDRIYATYCKKMGNKTSAEEYFSLIDHSISEIEGANLGVEVSYEPIKSHIYKYVSYVGTRIEQEEDLDELMGDPIDMTTGAFLQELSTLTLSGGSNLSFNLHYNSVLAEFEGEAGYGFSHDYEQWIEDCGSSIILHMSPYMETKFVNEEANANVSYGTMKDETVLLDGQTEYQGTYYPTGGSLKGWKIEKSGQGYVVTAKTQVKYTFGGDGKLICMEDADGKSVILTREADMVKLTDEITKEALYVYYDEAGKIREVRDDRGRTVSLEYNGGNLVKITGVGGKTSAYAYDSAHHMLHATNPQGLTYVKNTYDEEGRVLTQEEAARAGVTRISYENTSDGGVKIIATDATGAKLQIFTNAMGEKIKAVDFNGAVTEYLYDQKGNLLDETDTYGNKVMYRYDEENRLTASYDTAGNVTFTEYDEKGNPIHIFTQNSIGTTFTYDENNRMVRKVDALGAVTRYAYDEYGNLIRQIEDGKGILKYEYENGRMISQTDYNGNETLFEYDSYGNIHKKTDAMGNVTLYTYNEEGYLLSETAPDGTTSAYTYDVLGQKIKTVVTAPDGQSRSESCSYDGAGHVVKVTDSVGNTTGYTYDGHGNRTEVLYADGTKDRFFYDKASNLLKEITAAGIMTEYTYDRNSNRLTETTAGTTVSYEYYPNGKLYKKKLPDGQVYTYGYDENWNCILELDQSGNSTAYTYDDAGNRTSVRDALGNKTQYIYDNLGRCTKIIDPNGHSTYYEYDGNGNCISRTDAAGRTTHMTYDSLGRLTKSALITGAGEIETTYEYDVMGRITSVTDEEGITSHVAYDSFGNRKSVTDGGGIVTVRNQYDLLGRLTASDDALGNTTAYSYDRLGNVTKIVECLNSEASVRKTMTYDAGGRILTVKDAEDGITGQSYDDKGNIAAVIDACGGTTSYSYDSMCRVTEITNAVGARESYTYNTEGLLAESRDANGTKTDYTYDAAGRLVEKKDKEGTISYTYDANGNVLTVSDKNESISRTYDALNRVTAVTDYQGNTVKYAYDELGNRISITYPGGEKVRLSYYRNGNLKSVTDAHNNVTGYLYDKSGRLIKTSRADGSVETYTYNAAGWTLEIKDCASDGEIINHYCYSYDDRGNIVKIEGMDSAIAKTGIVKPEETETKETPEEALTAASMAMTYDADNRLVTYNGETVIYDDNGNMTHGPLNGAMADLTYDCRNRLIKVKEADGTVTEYEYDAENIRTAAITDGKRTEYTTDREAVYSQLLEETTLEKNIFGAYTEETSRKTYTYGLGLISERRDNGEEYHYHYNHLGSTTAVSDKEGNLVYRFVYDTYGELADIRDADKNSLGKIAASEHYTLSELAHAIGITFLYNGQYGVSTDRNGLYYMRARYYNQDIKRFINRDIVKGSITDSTSLNRYSYVQGNPVSLTDPFGLCPDPNSRFKSLCMAIYHTDWNNVGHTVLSVAGIFWEGADAINAVWYALEGNTEMALSCALSAIPGAGMAVGNLLMKSQKLSSAGRAIHAVSKLTQGGMGIGAGIGMAASGFGDFATGLKNGQFDGKALARGFLGVGIAALSGRNVAGTAKSINKAISNAGTPTKNPGGWGDISGAPVGMNRSVSAYDLMRERGISSTLTSEEIAAADALGLRMQDKGNSKFGKRPPNLTPQGAGRNGAFREAKRKSGIPVSEQPRSVTPSVDKRGNRIPGRDYDFGDGKVIREHSEGHIFPDDPSQNRGAHFNDPDGNHYDY